MTFKPTVLKILGEQYIPMSSLISDLKIDKVHLIFRMYQCTKFDIFEAKSFEKEN
jgi:hypothetical protein